MGNALFMICGGNRLHPWSEQQRQSDRISFNDRLNRMSWGVPQSDSRTYMARYENEGDAEDILADGTHVLCLLNKGKVRSKLRGTVCPTGLTGP